MPVFAYKAADAGGKVVRGSLEAPDARGAAGHLQEQGYIPIRIRPASGAPAVARLSRHGLGDVLKGLTTRIANRDVMRFTQELGALLAAGLPVDRSLMTLMDVTDNPRFRSVIGDVLRAVQGGAYLSDAMGKHPRAFSDFYVNMVRAGEAGGVLEAVLARLGEFLESSQELRDYIRSALVYPLFLVAVGGVSIIILMTFVIPKVSVIFADLGAAVPLSTRLLLAVSEGLRQYWWALLILIGLITAGLWRYAGSPAGRRAVDAWRLRLPVTGELTRDIEMARFARTLGTLVKSGVPILQALSLVKNIIGNRVIAGAMDRVRDRVKEGERLSRPLQEAGVFPPLAVQMITVGEESGHLDAMLLRVADNYEKTVRNRVKRLISLLEPAMILIMGTIVGFIVISMLMAIFSMNEIPF